MTVDIQKMISDLSGIFNEHENTITQMYNKAEEEDVHLMIFGGCSIHIDATLNGQKIDCVLDTGAQQNCMPLDVVERLKIHDLVDIQVQTRMYGVGGTSKTYGLIPYLPIEIGNFVTPTCFTVMQEQRLNCDCLIGLPFLRFYKANIDFDKNQLTLSNNVIPFKLVSY